MACCLSTSLLKLKERAVPAFRDLCDICIALLLVRVRHVSDFFLTQMTIVYVGQGQRFDTQPLKYFLSLFIDTILFYDKLPQVFAFLHFCAAELHHVGSLKSCRLQRVC